MPETGRLLSILWGQFRVSRVANMLERSPGREAVARAADFETGHASDEPGPFRASETSLSLVDESLMSDLMAAFDAKTQYPLASWIRGTAGNPCDLERDVEILALPKPKAVNERSAQSLSLRASSALGQYRFQKNGVLFDHNIAHAAGVGAAADGPGVQFVGGVSSGQSLYCYYANPHWPAPTITTADAKLQSDADGDFGTGAVDEHTFTQVTSTASYEFVTLPGPITNEHWRLSITAVTGGVYYPACLIWIF